MNEWMYDIMQFTVNDMLEFTTSHVSDAFNVRGRQGWELVGFTATPTSNETKVLVTCVWKRRAEQTPRDILR